MEDKILISILDEYKDNHDIKKFTNEYGDLEVQFHHEPPKNIGGDFHVLHGLLILIGAALFNEVFSDSYQVFKSKIYLFYSKIQKVDNNKSRVMNIVLKDHNVCLMFIFDLGLNQKNLDERFNFLKSQYLILLQSDHNNINYPNIYFFDTNLNQWIKNKDIN